MRWCQASDNPATQTRTDNIADKDLVKGRCQTLTKMNGWIRKIAFLLILKINAVKQISINFREHFFNCVFDV